MSKRRFTLRRAAPVFMRLFALLRPQLLEQRWLIGGAFVAMLAETAFRLLEPWPLKFVFDRVLPMTEHPAGKSGGIPTMTLLALAGVAVVFIAALRAGAAYFGAIGLALAGNRVLTSCRGKLFNHLQRLSLSFHDRARTGDLITRLIGDVGRLQEVTVTAALPLFVNALALIAMIVVMFFMHWRLGVTALAIFPLFALSMFRLTGRIRGAAARQRRCEGAMGASAAEALGAMRVVQALSLEEAQARAFASRNAASLKEGVRAKRLSARLERTVDVLIALGTAFVLWDGARLVVRGVLTPGDLIVFLAYLKSAFKPLRDLAKYTSRISKAAASAERILDIFDEKPTIQSTPNAPDAPAHIHQLRFENVSFSYVAGSDTLRKVSLKAVPGMRIAIVGASGAGKSTLVALLLRLYDPTAGRITMNGVDIRSLTIESVRLRFAIVLQESVLFADTIRENIRLGRPGATDEEIEAAAKLASADEFIRALPDSYDTAVGERGETLSGGQRQRIAIARAALRDAPILILDEPTTGLDAHNQRLVSEALARLAHDRITFIISHDLTATEDADLTLVMDEGGIVEQGSHTDLLNQGGRYANLHSAHRPDMNTNTNGSVTDALAR